MRSQFFTFSLSVKGRPVAFRALENLLRVFPVAKSDTDYSEPLKPREQQGQVQPGHQAPQGPPSMRHGAGAGRVAFKDAPVLFFVSILKSQLPMSLLALAGIRQPIIADDLRCPVSTPTFWPEPVRDAGQEDAHRRQPLLAVHHADGLYHTRRPGFREGQECATVVCGIGAGRRDRHEILDEPFDVGLTPTVPTLPARHDVLNLSVEEFKKLDVMGLHATTVKTVAPSGS